MNSLVRIVRFYQKCCAKKAAEAKLMKKENKQLKEIMEAPTSYTELPPD